MDVTLINGKAFALNVIMLASILSQNEEFQLYSNILCLLSTRAFSRELPASVQ